MTREASIIELGHWLNSAPGRQMLAWEQAYLDHAVADAFGFHALQLGLPSLPGLRANRMPHRWVAVEAGAGAGAASAGQIVADTAVPDGGRISLLHCNFDALAFPSASLDLVVMPHVLELAVDPHHTLREVERVLVPEGRLVITGLNPASLWGLRQRGGHAWRGMGFSRRAPMFLPRAGEFIGYWRLRDWLRLLGFEVASARFGAYRPPLRSQRWLDRFAWMDRVGDRWWPVLGAVYALDAIKHVRGMRLVGLSRQRVPRGASTPAVVAQRQREPSGVEAG